MKFTNFCGIFATVFVTTTIILLASCSQDDDNYESDMYTLAEMGTRSGGGDPGNGGGTPNPPIPYNGNPVKAGADTISFDIEPDAPVELYINWSNGYTGLSDPVSNISIIADFWPILWENCVSYSIISSTGTWDGYNNDMKMRIRYSKDSLVRENGRDSMITQVKDYRFDYHADCFPDSTLRPQ